MHALHTPDSIPFWGGALCLDFVNSVDWDGELRPFEPEQTDVLGSSSELARWGRRAGLLLREPAARDEGEHGSAIELRAALYRIFADAADGTADDLATVQASYREAVAEGALALREARWLWEWPVDELRTVRFAVAADAVSLLADPARLARVTRCPGRCCGWLFMNTSGRRRWCSMATCGSREKMRRMYRRRSG